MPTTPEEWLPILAQRMDERMPRVLKLRRYSRGDADLPEMGRNTRKSWEAFQKKARKNVAGLACSSLAGRIVPNGLRVGASSSGELLDALKVVWRNNRLAIVIPGAIWDMLSVGIGHLVVGIRDGEPIITSEGPERVYVEPDPVQPWRARASLQAWRDTILKQDFALVTVPGLRQRFERSTVTQGGSIRGKVSGDWTPVGEPEVFDGPPPVFVLENFGGVAEFEPHLDAIDAVNLGKLQRLVVTAYQAFKARAFKNLPETDDDGNAIDWASRLNFAPGAMVDLPEGIDIWESGAVEIAGLLEGEKTDLRDLAAVMQVPLDVFIPSGQNQSATGAANAHKGEIQKAKDRLVRAALPVDGALLLAARVLGFDVQETIQSTWEPPEHIALSEKAAAASQARAAGKSQRWIDEHIWGMSPDEIEAEQTERAREQLEVIALTGAPGGDA
ncbi:hypothetical protein [Homoserinibacter sp. GY 40078]|uniref:hypothetical protein n=1 Tax=Homoserinibacter sp. GY 40078 TaxID=2603275 RepID=UPI0011CAACB8|nr:hypothetical protein [Homoserinibacter sp. GY 40078]TXK17398.1 hypothetical protein FVQ89_11225 [Homoserinibacter sp. GY 40078]